MTFFPCVRVGQLAGRAGIFNGFLIAGIFFLLTFANSYFGEVGQKIFVWQAFSAGEGVDPALGCTLPPPNGWGWISWSNAQPVIAAPTPITAAAATTAANVAVAAATTAQAAAATTAAVAAAATTAQAAAATTAAVAAAATTAATAAVAAATTAAGRRLLGRNDEFYRWRFETQPETMPMLARSSLGGARPVKSQLLSGQT